MDIYNVAIAGHHINLIRAMRDYHSRHYMWEISKILIPALLTGFITFLAMRIIDNKNKKRWLNDTFIKHKNDLILQTNKVLLDFFIKFDEYFNGTMIDIKLVNSFFNEYADEFKEFKDLYYELLEVYKIRIKPLIHTLAQLDYLKNYVEENIKSHPDKLTIIIPEDETEISLEDYLNDISAGFANSKNGMIKIIQKKLK